MRNVLTNVLGVRDGVEVHVSERTLRGGEALLLCSDGLTDPLIADDEGRDVVAASSRAPLHERARACSTSVAIRGISLIRSRRANVESVGAEQQRLAAAQGPLAHVHFDAVADAEDVGQHVPHGMVGDVLGLIVDPAPRIARGPGNSSTVSCWRFPSERR